MGSMRTTWSRPRRSSASLWPRRRRRRRRPSPSPSWRPPPNLRRMRAPRRRRRRRRRPPSKYCCRGFPRLLCDVNSKNFIKFSKLFKVQNKYFSHLTAKAYKIKRNWFQKKKKKKKNWFKKKKKKKKKK